jgi:uncharacterized tellurite resistance protein B-like protein
MSLRRWLGLTDDPADPPLAGLDAIERELDGLDPERARFVACFAYILGRVARADHHVTEAESTEMARLISARVGLPPAQASMAVQIATAHGVKHGGTDDFLVSREFARIADRDQRLALLDCLYALSSSDRSIVLLEDNEVRRIASELNLEHADFIRTRAGYVEHLNVLRTRTDTGAPDAPATSGPSSPDADAEP